MLGVLDQLSATIEKIYAAAADGSRWGEAFAEVERLTDCAGVVVNLVAKEGATESRTLFGPRILEHSSSSEVEDYDRDLLPICPRVAAGIAHPNAPYLCDYMIISESAMDRDPVYDWYGRHGLRYFVGSTLGETNRHRLMWSVQRTPNQGHAQDDDIRLFELLKPHVARSLILADQLGTLRSQQRFNSAVLEALPQAVFALDANGTLLFANAPGRDLLAAADGISVTSGRLQTLLPRDQALLDSIIRGAIVSSSGSSSGWVSISRRSRRLAYAVFVAPLHGAEEELTAAAAKVLVIVHDPAAHRCADEQMLTSLYGLTGAEARLASALSGGHSLESAAVLLCIRPSTARAHLKAVFRKVGINRQQDLVRLLASLSTAAPAV